jgi:hypothetical protein
MLSVRLPREAIMAKMVQEGLNPSYLDKAPRELIRRDGSSSNNLIKSNASSSTVSASSSSSSIGNRLGLGLGKLFGTNSGTDQGGKATPAGPTKVPVSEHPIYSKYFKMKKVGLPQEAIRAKMQQEGADPTYLDKESNELVSMSESGPGLGGRIKSMRIKSMRHPVPLAGKINKVRKKKLYWKALDSSQVGKDSVWADKDKEDDITLDEVEFNKLFVESNEDIQKRPLETGGRPMSVMVKSLGKKRVNLIDAKRGQNAGIALARIKISLPEVRERILLMNDEGFSTDQLRSLLEYLPSPDESSLIQSFLGDVNMLGQAEKYMKVMVGFDTAAERIQVMIYKQQFKGRVAEVTTTLTTIENACDDVKLSVRLKKVLKTILKVGNQMNDGEKHLGFTLDSLLKLQSAKAFDKKTSILQYVIMLIYRNDEKCLAFPDELSHCAEASRLTLDSNHQVSVRVRI